MPHPTSSTSQRPAAFAPCPASGVTSGSIPDTPSGPVSCATSRPAPAATPGSVLCTTSCPAPAATPRPAAISVVRPSTATAASPVAAAAPVSAAFPVPLFAATITAVSGSSGPLPAAAGPSAPGRAGTAEAVRSRISPPKSESQILRAIFRSTRKCWPSAFLALTSLILFQQFIITAVHARSVHDKSAVHRPHETESGFGQHPLRSGIRGVCGGKDTNYRGICENPLRGPRHGGGHNARPRYEAPIQQPIPALNRPTSVSGANPMPPTALPPITTAKSSGRDLAAACAMKASPSPQPSQKKSAGPMSGG